MIVKLQGDGYLVNNQKSVPNDPRNTDYQAVQRWLTGHTDEWLALKAQHDKEVEAHANWLAIQSYDANVATYQTALEAYNTWEFTEETPVKPEMPVAPPKPKGYYTQEEVDESQAKWDEWKALSDAYVPTEFSPTFTTPEPVVLQRPADIPEPSITPLPDPVPNTPLPEFTQEELAAQEANKVRAKRDALLAEADILMFKAFDNNEDTTALKSYRQELRDMTTQVGFPYDVTYPVLG